MRFWDSSAVVPLIVHQTSSSDAEAWIAEDPEAVTWTLTGVEIVSALRRLVRGGALGERTAIAGEALAADVLRSTHVVTDVERVKPTAMRLLRVHTLRAADALQLAAALAWADGSPTGLVLHTFDRRLGLAAEREGFRVVPEPA
ncbi:MAG: PIN domain-containing protein [Candidatus Binatia bacterium]